MVPTEEQAEADHHCGDDLEGELALLPLGKLSIGLCDGGSSFSCGARFLVAILATENPLGVSLGAAFAERLQARDTAMGGDFVLVNKAMRLHGRDFVKACSAPSSRWVVERSRWALRVYQSTLGASKERQGRFKEAGLGKRRRAL